MDKSYRLQLTGYDTIGDLIKRGLFKEAEELRKEFKLSDTVLIP
jgi:hypothetical protein